MNREEMIRRLVSFSVEAALKEPQSYWLQELFEKGFSGYRKFSYSKLKRELELRGLGDLDDGYGEDDVEDIIPEDMPESISGYANHSREVE